MSSLRKPEWFVICIAAIAVLILTSRAALGPFRLWMVHVEVNSPFGAESAFWLAILALLLLRREVAVVAPKNEGAGFPAVHLAICLGLIVLAFAHNLADPFLSDDYVLLSGPPFHWNTFVASLQRPGGDGAFRPLGAVYYQLVQSVAGLNPVGWHVVGLTLHLLNASLVFAIAWKLWRDKTTAAVASLVFGLNGTRPEVALWTAGNWDLLASGCALGSIALALSQRERGRLLRLTFSLLLLATGILCKESAYATPLIVFALAFALPDRRAARHLRLFLAGSCCVCAASFAWRWLLFHGPGGYIDKTTGRPAILSVHPLTAAKAVFLRIWAVLLTPVNWDAPRTWWLPIAVICSLLGLVLLAATLRSGVSRRTQLCLIAATCCAVLPAIHLALIGESALGSRVLYLAGAPFALLIGSLVEGAGRRGVVIAAIMLAGTAGILEHNLNAWHLAATEGRTLCRDATPPPSGAFDGVVLFQNGFAECVAMERNRKRR